MDIYSQTYNFAAWVNAYCNPGQDGEGSDWQWRALEEMARLANTAEELVHLYCCATGCVWVAGYWRDKCAADAQIAKEAMQKLQALEASREDWFTANRLSYNMDQGLRALIQQKIG